MRWDEGWTPNNRPKKQHVIRRAAYSEPEMTDSEHEEEMPKQQPDTSHEEEMGAEGDDRDKHADQDIDPEVEAEVRAGRAAKGKDSAPRAKQRLFGDADETASTSNLSQAMFQTMLDTFQVRMVDAMTTQGAAIQATLDSKFAALYSKFEGFEQRVHAAQQQAAKADKVAGDSAKEVAHLKKDCAATKQVAERADKGVQNALKQAARAEQKASEAQAQLAALKASLPAVTEGLSGVEQRLKEGLAATVAEAVAAAAGAAPDGCCSWRHQGFPHCCLPLLHGYVHYVPSDSPASWCCINLPTPCCRRPSILPCHWSPVTGALAFTDSELSPISSAEEIALFSAF